MNVIVDTSSCPVTITLNAEDSVRYQNGEGVNWQKYQKQIDAQIKEFQRLRTQQASARKGQ